MGVATTPAGATPIEHTDPLVEFFFDIPPLRLLRVAKTQKRTAGDAYTYNLIYGHSVQPILGVFLVEGGAPSTTKTCSCHSAQLGA